MIFLECNNDEFLIKSLGFTRRQISHVYNKGEVVKRVGKAAANAIGIIDKDLDRDRPKEMNKYIKVKGNGQVGDITLFQMKEDKRKKLVQISPYLEHWLLHRAKRNNIRLKNFNLPDDSKKLHSMTNLDRNKNFQKFLKKRIDIDPEIQTLKKWIEEVLE
jgi:hypothetical protein